MKKAFHDSIQLALRKGWADFSSTINGLENEVQRHYQAVRERVNPQHARDELQDTIQDMGRRIQETGEGLEREVEARIRTMVSMIKDPLVEELSTLREQAEKMGQRIDSQVRRVKKQEAGGDEQATIEPSADAK